MEKRYKLKGCSLIILGLLVKQKISSSSLISDGLEEFYGVADFVCRQRIHQILGKFVEAGLATRSTEVVRNGKWVKAPALWYPTEMAIERWKNFEEKGVDE